MTFVTLDYETWPIFQRPFYPPRPVGLALHSVERGPDYMSWGHKSGRNNCLDESYARELLGQMWADPTVEFICHHAKFDMAVAQEAWGLPPLPWHRVHDTTFLAFLCDPHAKSGALKPLAADWLDMPPDEQDAVAAWVQAHKTELMDHWNGAWRLEAGKGIDSLKVQKGKEGAWIFAAPAELVHPYAIGDVVRTRGLFDIMLATVRENGMEEAYDRERQVMPILMANERIGMRTDLGQLESDIERYGRQFEYVEAELRRVLHAGGLNFDADQDVAGVLISQGIIPESNFSRTAATKTHPNGQYAMSKDDLLPEIFTGPNGRQVASALGYRNRLKTCLDTFMRPWQAQASINGGYITTNWNQVRGYTGGGTRSGRPSTNDFNFLNISKSFEGRDDQYVHPAFLGLDPLPLCRTYILPDPGEVFIHRDFNGQELRVFAHFEQGDLWHQYQADPNIDVHAFVGAELMLVANREIERTKVKSMNFQGIYGGGAPALSAKLRVSLAEAKQLKLFHDQALPGRKILAEEIKRVVMRGDPIRTWGGRLYFPEEPGPDGRSKIYKLLNYIVQGTAADLTKQAMIEWDAAHRELPPWVPPARFLVQVYDELNLSAPPEYARAHMGLLRAVMEQPRLSVPMVSDGKWGLAWGKLEKYKDE